jgi:hypothetical protein
MSQETIVLSEAEPIALVAAFAAPSADLGKANEKFAACIARRVHRAFRSNPLIPDADLRAWLPVLGGPDNVTEANPFESYFELLRQPDVRARFADMNLRYVVLVSMRRSEWTVPLEAHSSIYASAYVVNVVEGKTSSRLVIRTSGATTIAAAGGAANVGVAFITFSMPESRACDELADRLITVFKGGEIEPIPKSAATE